MDVRERIRADLTLSDARREHTFGVVQAALTLADTHFKELDLSDVETAALLHDFTKEYSVSQHEAVCRMYGDRLSEAEYASPQLMHAHTASLIASNVYHVSDEIAHAIKVHTTGCRNMSPLDIVIYLGDYIEPNRKGEYCCAVRDVYLNNGGTASDRALYLAMLESFDRTLSHLLQIGAQISEDSVSARNEIINVLSAQ